MSPALLKGTAIAFALLSLAFLVAGLKSWKSQSANQVGTSSNRGGCRGGLILLAVSGSLFGGLWTLAADMGWSRDRALWVGLGGFVGVMTLVRPWWFWDNWRAHALRDTIGDETTAVLYLALAAAMVCVGLYTDWPFGRR